MLEDLDKEMYIEDSDEEMYIEDSDEEDTTCPNFSCEKQVLKKDRKDWNCYQRKYEKIYFCSVECMISRIRSKIPIHSLPKYFSNYSSDEDNDF